MGIPMINFCIIEDEMDVQKGLKAKLESMPGVVVLGEADDVPGAYDLIVNSNPDAVFLDIQLLGGNAFQLLDLFRENGTACPPIILMTGFAEFQYAQKALNEHRHCILKILEKPFLENFESQFEEIRLALLAHNSQQQSQIHKTNSHYYIVVKQGNVSYRFEMDDIDFIEVGGSGSIFLVTSDGRHIQVQQTLNSFLENVSGHFVKIHRNNAINLRKLSHIDHENRLVFLRGHTKGLSIGRTYYPSVVKLFH